MFAVMAGGRSSTFDDVPAHVGRLRNRRRDGSGNCHDAAPGSTQVSVRSRRSPQSADARLVGDGAREGEGGGAGRHGLLLRAGGAEARPGSEEHPVRGGPVQDVEGRQVSFGRGDA